MQFTAFLRVLTLIHASLLLGLLAFSVIVYFNNPDFETGIDSNDLFVYLVPMTAVIAYFGSTFIFQKFLQAIEPQDKLQEKLNKYQTATIIKYALLEGAAILALMAYYVQGNIMHLIIALCLMVYLYSQRPTKKNFLKDVKLSSEELKQLQK
ncbi:hypothetical protein N9954_06930 [Maribacter sp.]|nr:hypothetical protein [Maribacter sp.]